MNIKKKELIKLVNITVDTFVIDRFHKTLTNRTIKTRRNRYKDQYLKFSVDEVSLDGIEEGDEVEITYTGTLSEDSDDLVVVSVVKYIKDIFSCSIIKHILNCRIHVVEDVLFNLSRYSYSVKKFL